jgi:putative endonuclease
VIATSQLVILSEAGAAPCAGPAQSKACPERSRRESLPPCMTRQRRSYCAYIMGSLSGTLYIGVTGNLHKRTFEHKFHRTEGFTSKYEIERLLYWESFDDVHKAIAREKQLKGWRREKKVALIESTNPHWLDLSKDWYPWMKESGPGRDASTPSAQSQATGQPPLSMTTRREH